MKTSLIIKRTLFYCLSFTWGIIMSLIGLIAVTSIGLFKGFHTYHGRLFTSIGKNWGGVSLGCFFICSEDCINSEHLKAHECGHGLQSIVFGPLFPFVVAIPSMIFSNYFTRRVNKEIAALESSVTEVLLILTGKL